MVSNKDKSSTSIKYASVFGAALSSAFVTQEIQADVLDISWNAGQASVQVTYERVGSCSPPFTPLDIDQLGIGRDLLVFYGTYECSTGIGSGVVDFQVRSAFRDGQIASLGFVERGDVIDPQTLANLGNRIRFDGPDGSGFAAFRTTDGNVGWFKIEVDEINEVVTFAEGEVATMGESLVVGGNDLCGAAVDLLDGVLTIEGTSDDDVIAVSTANGMVTAELNGCEESYPVGSVAEVVIDGDDGADNITVNFSDGKTIMGGADNDTITVNGRGLGADIFGEEGDDTIVGGAGPDFILGGAGNDDISGRGGADILDGGAPRAGFPDMNIINGGNGADLILGGEDVDIVFGNDGADRISLFGGDDIVDAGSGSDEIFSGAGNDLVIGGPAADLISGGAGDDELDGGAGQDTIFGGAGEDVITGGAANDVIQGGTGNDTINGNAGLDTLGGGAGDDTITGGVGNDTISGGPGNDTLNGQAQHDVIHGDGGDDTLTGGLGFDELHGGAGVDTATDTGEAGETGIEN